MDMHTQTASCILDHNSTFGTCKRVLVGARLLGTACDYDQLLAQGSGTFHNLKVSTVEGLKASNKDQGVVFFA
jgi:hypothetical protein